MARAAVGQRVRCRQRKPPSFFRPCAKWSGLSSTRWRCRCSSFGGSSGRSGRKRSARCAQGKATWRMLLANVLHAIDPDLLGRKATHPYPHLRKGQVSHVCREGEHQVCQGCYCTDTRHPYQHVWEGP